MQFIGIAVWEASFLNHASCFYVLETDLTYNNKQRRLCPDVRGGRAKDTREGMGELAFILFWTRQERGNKKKKRALGFNTNFNLMTLLPPFVGRRGNFLMQTFGEGEMIDMTASMTSAKTKVFRIWTKKLRYSFGGREKGGVYVYSNQALFPFIGSFDLP